MKTGIRGSLLAALFFFTITVSAQSPNTMLTLGVLVPGPSNDFTQEQIQKLEAKIVQLINNSNEVSVGYTNDFIVYPVISVEESNVVEGGMQNITVTSVDFSLYVRQASTKMIYNTFSKKIKGSGNNKAQSITNAISQIKTMDEGYKQFIATAKTKILNYYSENCKTILQTADNVAAKNNYEEAIGILQSVPVASKDCYDEAQKKSLAVYKKYQSVLCSKNITKAKGAIAVKNYSEALEALEVIDPTATCYPEVKGLLDQISSKVEKKEKQDLELEKQRIEAAKEIGKAYYSNTIRLISYDVFIN